MGSSALGTGDGSQGNLDSILNGENRCKIEIDFAISIGPLAHTVLGDIDQNETMTVQSFTGSPGNYTAVSLTEWMAQNFKSQETSAPFSDWATWNPTGGGADNGVFTTTADSLNDPLNVMTPSQSDITRLIFAEGGPWEGGEDIQIMTTDPEPTSFVLALSGIFSVSGAS